MADRPGARDMGPRRLPTPGGSAAKAIGWRVHHVHHPTRAPSLLGSYDTNADPPPLSHPRVRQEIHPNTGIGPRLCALIRATDAVPEPSRAVGARIGDRGHGLVGGLLG